MSMQDDAPERGGASRARQGQAPARSASEPQSGEETARGAFPKIAFSAPALSPRAMLAAAETLRLRRASASAEAALAEIRGDIEEAQICRAREGLLARRLAAHLAAMRRITFNPDKEHAA